MKEEKKRMSLFFPKALNSGKIV